MRGGVLTIGSLFWDEHPARKHWRESRLAMDQKQLVQAPITYGRRSGSRGGTYTMTFADVPFGQAALIPFRNELTDFTALEAEAFELWKAEDPKSTSRKIGAAWGCVGAQFRDANNDNIRNGKDSWAGFFSNTASIHPVTKKGILKMPWPLANDGKATELDVILATATRAEDIRPSPEQVADAWIEQNEGHEMYFLQNVRCGMRTSSDLQIWKRIEARQPSWLKLAKYAESVGILRGEADRKA
jgi:hypothetical protein